MRRYTHLFVAVVALAVVLAALPAAAQGSTSGSIRGTVTDPGGGVLPGVQVIATSDALVGGQQVSITNTQGTYRFPSLPPGSYVIEAYLDGFQPVRQENVRVGLGQSIEIPLQMGDITVSEEIVVVAEAIQLSTVSNAAAYNLAEDYIERQPVVRDPTELMNYAPGINDDQAYGAPSSYQNAYNFDGVDVSDPELGSQWVLPSMDWVQEVQVAGLGADAEYGGFTGAVVNLVTKSGGNEFHGDVRAYYSGGGLNSDNAPEGVEGTNTLDSDSDVSASFGGPVLRDSLWYFVSGNWRESVVDPFFASSAPVDDREQDSRTETRVLGKLTWQANESNRVLFLVDWDDAQNDYRGVGDVTLASAAQKQDSPNYVYNVAWESLVNDNNFTSVKLTGYVGGDDRLPYHGNAAGRYDLDSGFEWVNLDQRSEKDVDRTALDASWSFFADGLITSEDTHNFRIGVLYETSAIDYITRRNGGFTIVDDSYYGGDDGYGCATLDEYFTDPSCALFSSDWGGEWDLQAELTGVHLYAQDSWSVGPVTINAGVRYTTYQGSFKSASGDVYDENMIAPRLGFVWDLFGDGRAALKAHYGVYYEGMTVTIFDREASGNALSDTEYYDYNFDTGEFDIPAGGSVEARAAMDPGIEHPSVEQLVLTYEHQIARDMVVGVDYIHRENKDVNAMVVSNVGDYDVLFAPDSPITGEDLPFFDLLAPQEYVITNPEEATRDYDSVALRLRKRYSDGWSLDGSLVWSDLTGTADYSLTGYGTGFDDLNGFVNADGKLPYNSEWVFKVSASVDLPWDILLSGFYQFRTGEYWTPYVRFRGLYYNDRENVFLTERGSQEYDDRSVLDLKLQKSFKLGGGKSMGLFVDVFNLLDSEKVTAVTTRWGDYFYDYADHPGNSEFVASSSYQTPLAIQTPRRVRFGAKFSF